MMGIGQRRGVRRRRCGGREDSCLNDALEKAVRAGFCAQTEGLEVHYDRREGRFLWEQTRVGKCAVWWGLVTVFFPLFLLPSSDWKQNL